MFLISVNGKLQPDDQPTIMAADRAYRYADGLFETIKVKDSRILLANLHFDRLFSGLQQLSYNIPNSFTREKITEEILVLCRKNNLDKTVRVRLSVTSDEKDQLKYIIESFPLDESFNELNAIGWKIDIYPDAIKSLDEFSSLKSPASICYPLAEQHAKKNGLDDCLVLNSKGRIADSSIANIFIINDGTIITPSLSEGCVNGVMRKHILGTLPKDKYRLIESVLSIEDLENADEVFLTNAIRVVRWVEEFRGKKYSNEVTRKIYADVLMS